MSPKCVGFDGWPLREALLVVGAELCPGLTAADAASNASAASRAPIQYGAGTPRWSKARPATTGPTIRVTLITACNPPMTLPCSSPTPGAR